jgi:hypothetical protein
MQFETLLVARTPRVNCPEHGVKTIEAPWAGKNCRFTLMFEAFAIRVLEAWENIVRRVSWSRENTTGVIPRTPSYEKTVP